MGLLLHAKVYTHIKINYKYNENTLPLSFSMLAG